MRVWIAQGSHNCIPCFTSRIAADDDRALYDFACSIVQFPESLVFTESQALLWLVGEITDSRALRVVVAVRDVAFREWRLYENSIFDEGAVAVPYQALGVNSNKINLKGMISRDETCQDYCHPCKCSYFGHYCRLVWPERSLWRRVAVDGRTTTTLHSLISCVRHEFFVEILIAEDPFLWSALGWHTHSHRQCVPKTFVIPWNHYI